ncbi:MAG: iron complex outermembrane receptor protein [Bacteroidia bacterium]|jgi:iron complex outermembrane receptor protein
MRIFPQGKTGHVSKNRTNLGATMRTNTRFQISTLSAAIAATMISGYSETALSATLEEVMVTATRRSESIQDIPINITALSGDLIARERLDNLSDIARRVPGMTVIDQGSRSSNVTTVRGLNTSSVTAQDGANDGGGTVATYLGDVPMFVDLKLVDMDRVEVLIGPQGTLYGAGTLAGAIRYLPNRPQADAFTIDIRGEGYSLNQSDSLGYDVGGTINIPIIEDRLAFRASVDYEDDPGFIDYNFLVREAGVSNPQPDFSNPADVRANLKQEEDANTTETLSSRLALRYTGDVLDGTLTYYYQNRDSGGRQINHSDAFGTGDFESAQRFLEPSELENELLALELVWDLGFAELTSATGYGEYTEEGQRDQTDLLLQFAFGELYGYGYDTFPSFSAFTREKTEEQTLTQEFRLVSTGEGRFNWIVGTFYSDFENDATSSEFAPGYDEYLVDVEGVGVQLRPDSLEYIEVTSEDREEFAVFGEIGFDITDKWQITVGARYFEYEVEASGGFNTPLLNTVIYGDPVDSINLEIQTNEADDDDIILKFNTSYDFTDDVMGYLTVSEGYRNGIANSVPECPTPLPPNQQNLCAQPDEVLVKSDTTVNYEIGVHSQFGDRAILNAALFFIDWDDIRVDGVTENGGLTILKNGGTAESMGLELSGQLFITPDFSINGAYSYTKAELTENAPGILDGEFDTDTFSITNLDGEDGDRLPGSPEHQVYLAANYAISLDGGSAVDLNWSMVAQGDVLTKLDGRASGEELSGFAVHNVSVNWVMDEATVSLYADNVFDREYETGVRRDPSYITPISLFDLRRYYTNVGRPRQIGVRFNYSF